MLLQVCSVLILDEIRECHWVVPQSSWLGLLVVSSRKLIQQLQELAVVINLGLVVQSIISLTSSLKGQFVKCFTT